MNNEHNPQDHNTPTKQHTKKQNKQIQKSSFSSLPQQESASARITFASQGVECVLQGR